MSKTSHHKKFAVRILALTTILLTPLILFLAISSPAHADDLGFDHGYKQFVYFYKPPSNNDLQTLSKYFNTFILTRKDETTVRNLKKMGVNTPFLQYYLTNAIHNPGPNSCTATPYGNTVADTAGDYCYIRDNHPDWFLRDINDKIVQEWNGAQLIVYMDPANPGWQQFFIQRALERHDQYAGEWEGLFLDNLDASLARFSKQGIQFKKYTDDASYRNAFKPFLTALRQGYAAKTGHGIFANITEFKNSAAWFEYMQYLDGAMDEGWAVDWHTGYKPTSEWLEDLNRIKQTQALEKRAILVAQGDSKTDYKRQQFAYASYLLITDGHAAFRYASANYYHEAWIYANYDIDLGTPVGSFYSAGTNLYRRNFTKGYVTVNPVTRESAIILSPMNLNFRTFLTVLMH